jgi:hypothetical protein
MKISYNILLVFLIYRLIVLQKIFIDCAVSRALKLVYESDDDYTGPFKKKYTLSKMYFTSNIEHMATCDT